MCGRITPLTGPGKRRSRLGMGPLRARIRPLRARNRTLRTPIRTQRARIRKAPQTTIWALRTRIRKMLDPFPNIPYPMVASKNGEAGRGRPDPITEPC